MRYVLIISLTLWAFLIVLAVYEWKVLAVLALIGLFFVIRGMGRQAGTLARLRNPTTKEDDAP